MTRTFSLLPIVIGVCLTSPSICSAQNAAIPDQVAERMLTAIGGRTAWASLSNTINDSQQNRLVEPTLVRAVITMDFTRPRFRIETTAPNLHLIRVIDGQRNWRLNRQCKIENVPAEVVRDPGTSAKTVFDIRPGSLVLMEVGEPRSRRSRSTSVWMMPHSPAPIPPSGEPVGC